MKHFPKLILAVASIALLAASFHAAKVAAHRDGGAVQRTTFRIPAHETPQSFEETIRNGEVVGMTAIKAGGGRVVLKAQSKPTCATSCPAGQHLSCWEDEEQMMSMCACSGGTGTPHGTITFIVDGAQLQ